MVVNSFTDNKNFGTLRTQHTDTTRKTTANGLSFQHLENMEFVLKPFQEAQRELEGEHYVNLSLLPLVIGEMKDQLGICEAAASQNMQQQLVAPVADMWEDFHEHWGDTVTYSTIVIHSHHRHQKEFQLMRSGP